MIKILNLTLITLTISCLHLTADTKIADFSDTGKDYNVTDRGSVSESVALRNGSLELSAPNSWTRIAQITGLNSAIRGADGSESLVVRIRGKVTDIGPYLDLAFFNQDWSRCSVYRVPIGSLSETDFRDFKSETPLSQPLDEHQALGGREPLILGETLGALQIVPGVETGNRPWDLSIRYVMLGD